MTTPGDDLTVKASLQDELSGPLERLTHRLDEVGRSAEGSGRKAGLAQRGFGKLTSGISGLAKTAGRTGVLALGALGTAAGVAGVGIATMAIKAASANQQAMISFTTMLGSAKKAGAFLNDLKKFAAATPFEFPELQTAASSLISAGIQADKVIPIMRTLGDVTSGMGTGSEGVQRATVALQQMSAAGKISGEDLNQLRDAGIPVYDLLAKATGKSKAAVVALAQAGKLGSKELGQMMSALESGKGLERFSGLMDKQSQSLAGVWSTLKDTVSQGLGDALTPFLPQLSSLVGKAGELAGRVMPKLSSGIAAVVSKATELWHTFRDNGSLESVKAIFSSIGTVLGTMVPTAGGASSAMGFLAKALKAAALIFAFFARHATAVKVVVLALAMVFGGPVTAILALGAAVVWAYNKFPIFAKVVDVAVTTVVGFFQGLLRAFASVLKGLGHVPGFGWAKKAGNALDDLADTLDKVKDAMAGIPKEKEVVITAKLAGSNAAKAALASGATAAQASQIATRVSVTSRRDFAGGDTASSRARGGGLGATMAAHARYSAATGSRARITNALVGGGGLGRGSGDHQAGRALDLRGPGLNAYAAAVRADGGFAAFHGSGGARHLHAVPAGDTATPRGGRGMSSGGGGTVVQVAPGAITVYADGLDEDAAKRVAVAAVADYFTQRSERR